MVLAFDNKKMDNLLTYNILLMFVTRIPTEIATARASMIRNLQSFIDYFLDDVTKQIIKKYDFEELDSDFDESLHQHIKIRIIGIKVFLLYQNSLKRVEFYRLRLIQVKNKYVQAPISRICNLLGTHPVTIYVMETFISTYQMCHKQLCVAITILSHYLHLIIQKVKQSQLKTHAEEATNRLKRVIQAAFCFTQQTIMYKRSKQLYNYVQGKYGELKRKFSSIKKQGEVLTQRIASENSCESFMFPEPLEMANKHKLLKVKSNEDLKKYPQKPRYGKIKVYEVVDELESSLEMSHRKPSMSECGGYSSQQQI